MDRFKAMLRSYGRLIRGEPMGFEELSLLYPAASHKITYDPDNLDPSSRKWLKKPARSRCLAVLKLYRSTLEGEETVIDTYIVFLGIALATQRVSKHGIAALEYFLKENDIDQQDVAAAIARDRKKKRYESVN